ncbi:MAG: SDR family oxidoreductase [Desulfobulbaceae bacterium]|nr:SDR family oxidoreductase [Desulfobulbaceae bacterium]
MDIDLTGNVALITGAARGIGLVVAEDLAREGVNVCGTDIRSDLLNHEMGRIAAQYEVETLAITADVGAEVQVVEMVQQAFLKWGQVDILINNAGIRQVAPIYDTTVSVWDEIQSANLRGQYLCTREVLKQGMLDRNEGVIIFISSGSGKRGEKGSSSYCASKFGVTGFAESVAKDLKDTKIRTSTIMPGMVWTPMAEESEFADQDVDWLDSGQVSKAILFCIKQDVNTIIPEIQIYHRSQI